MLGEISEVLDGTSIPIDSNNPKRGGGRSAALERMGAALSPGVQLEKSKVLEKGYYGPES
ncbi:MAG: hypothetical protein U5P10_17810 [Spirochaetia bacterium]|nr:hypothetical protein [Spirochaetia bacterium]